ncbi:MAG: S-layer homology domain-containing protein [Candidatus Metalachnospira sp.]|nr:S-layer homology domain-containing protein [Candidatus Metalachnospira sp.]
MKKFITIFSAAAIALSSFGGTVAYGSVFADINNVPWTGAAQYIDEAYSLGLMAGYTENGSRYCKAKNNVTYCEAVQLMYSIMSSYSGTSVSSAVISKWTSIMASNSIPSWAYSSVAYALENSILSTNDLSIFMSSSGNQNNARREDVAVIFGKALSKNFSIASNPTISYGDKASVSTTSVPYLELLNRLDIMVGDSSNNFNPKVNINRAEMAVLSSKAFNKLKSGGSTSQPGQTGQIVQYSGTVQSKTSNGSGYTFAVSGKTGGVSVTYTFTTTASTAVMNGSSTTTVEKINTGDTIVAVCNGTVASTIIITATGSTSTSTKSGTISSLTSSKISLKSSSTTTDYTINDSSNVTVTIDGSSSSFSSLKSKFTGGTNYTATVSLDSSGNVSKIVAKSSSSSSDDKTVSKLSSSSITLKSGDKYDFVDDDDLTVKLDSKTLDDIDDLVDKFKDMDDDEYMTVSLTLDKHDDVERIYATIETESSSSSSSVKGIISSISDDYVKIDGTKYYFPSDDDDVTMKYNDSTKSTIEKFVSAVDGEDSVYAEITLRSSKIYRITAIDGETKTGELKSIDTGAKEIEIGTKTYDYTSSTTFDITDGNSSITSASKLNTAIEEDDKTIEEATIVIDDDDKVICVTGEVTEVKGTIKTYKDSSTATSCYLTIDNDTSSTKYYFTKSTDFSGDCDDTDDLDKEVNDKENDVKVTITIEDGKITDIDCDVR